MPNGISKDDLKNLPDDSGGRQKAVPLNTDGADYGYYEYLPKGYDDNYLAYPLLVFLHGAGERGDSLYRPNDLKKLLNYGPPMLIHKQLWDTPYPMIVISPQCHETWWRPERINHFLKYLIGTYRINPDRIYLTGVSMGGFGAFSYLETFGEAGFVAAAAPVCGGGNPENALRVKEIPVWAFHGEDDRIVPAFHSIQMVEAINKNDPRVTARLTIFPEAGHESWTLVYDSSGRGRESGEYDPFSASIYEWFFRHKRKFPATSF